MSKAKPDKARILILGELQIRELEAMAIALESMAKGIREILAKPSPEWSPSK